MSFSADRFQVETGNGREVILLSPVTFVRPLDVGGQAITIPAGATSDGASIPPAVWAMLPPFGRYWRAAVLHDAAYRRQTEPPISDRATADLVFWEAMMACGVPLQIARLIYTAVRECGQAAWDQHRAYRPSGPDAAPTSPGLVTSE